MSCGHCSVRAGAVVDAEAVWLARIGVGVDSDASAIRLVRIETGVGVDAGAGEGADAVVELLR